jgi:hypothetical protein
MRKIIKRFVKFNPRREPIYGWQEELVDERDIGGGLTSTRQEVLFECPVCGQLFETDRPHPITSNCELCGGTCCIATHNLRLELDEIEFRRQILIERERMNRLQSPALDRIPLIKWLRWFQNQNSMARLEETRRRLLRERNERRLLR